MEAKPHCLDTAAHCPATCLWRTHTQLGKGTGPQSLRTPGSNTTGTHSFDLSCQSTELFHIFLFLGCVCVVRCRYHPAHDSALYWISRLSSLPWPWAPGISPHHVLFCFYRQALKQSFVCFHSPMAQPTARCGAGRPGGYFWSPGLCLRSRLAAHGRDSRHVPSAALFNALLSPCSAGQTLRMYHTPLAK